ncbi:uncharacterized protein DUF4406 [Paraburkholderia sp. BL8N3]|nr:DUF4406 domain-containing protein [Paraburkholderia sp. BL8N3]TCK39665.1 uncharacterized protein DUF4406 [Paraburkholderia sp. BL8N3]
MKIYVSGPMTGLPDLNKPAFNAEAARLRAEGHEVVNPAEVDLGPDAEWLDYMKVDIALMCPCDMIFMLPGWEKSEGARMERRIAMDLKLRVVYAAEAVAA